MEAIMVSAATGAMKSVLMKLSALLADEHQHFMGARRDIVSLTEELTAMHAFLENMSEVEDPDPQQKAQMTEVRELSYSLEDSIDQFMLCADDQSTKQERMIEKWKKLLTKIRSRRWVAKEMRALKIHVKEAGERHARYKISETIPKTRNITMDRRALAVFEDASKLVGINGPADEVTNLLTQGDRVGALQKLRVVSIVGLGGSGKTTLAKQVYEKLRYQFECQAFVSVSRNPNIRDVLRTILSEVSNQEYACTEAAGDEQQLIINLSNFLRDKRYLIVVDDLWKKETWETIKYALVQNSYGSRIITTTRIHDVAQSCCPSDGDHVYKIRPLSLVDSKRLFYRNIFGSEEQCPLHLEEVSDKILGKCDGLPLAIRSMTGLLASKQQTKDQWEEVYSSMGCALGKDPHVENMIKILSLSYRDLPYQIRTCMLYLSIFPEDYTIKKKRLIRRWLAEGFIHAEGRLTPDELGEMCFNELINRSLIEPVEINMCGQVKSCRVHDIILDFLVAKAVEENFVSIPSVNPSLGPINKVVRRLSLHDNNDESGSLTGMVLDHTRSLTVFVYSKVPSLLEFTLLRVLDLESCRQVRYHHLKQIRKLLLLKYLSLKDTELSKFPEQIGELYNLQTLNLQKTHITDLPATLVHLRGLVNLLVDRKVKLPDRIGNMQGLVVLKKINLLQQSANFVQELGKLTNIRNLRLSLYPGGSDDAHSYYTDYKERMVSSLCKLCSSNLHSLTIDIADEFDDGFLQRPWSPAPHSLQKLVIRNGLLSRVPNWVGSLVNLQRLFLRVKEVGQQDVLILGGIPALVFLSLYICTTASAGSSDQQRVEISSSHGFSCLRCLTIGGSEWGFGFIFSAGSMPKLQELMVGFSAGETNCLTNGDFDFGIKHLFCLRSVRCDIYCGGGTRKLAVAAKASIENAISSHPNRPCLEVHITGFQSEIQLHHKKELGVVGQKDYEPNQPIYLNMIRIRTGSSSPCCHYLCANL